MDDKSAIKLWENANKSLENYQEYIKSKQHRFILTYVDLLYISNFKGGNASIHEDENKVNDALKKYSKLLRDIDIGFYAKNLRELTIEETENLIELTLEFIDFTKKENIPIYGFKVSLASALLHAYFPDLIPIVDRRVLISKLGIEVKSMNQKLYIEAIPRLINEFQKELKLNNRNTLRSLDKKYFGMVIE